MTIFKKKKSQEVPVFILTGKKSSGSKLLEFLIQSLFRLLFVKFQHACETFIRAHTKFLICLLNHENCILEIEKVKSILEALYCL